MQRILIIDDEPAVCTMLRDGLEYAGYQVLTALDGDRGLTLYREQSPDLVITDLLMPEKDGLELIREILETSSYVKIIAMSGGSSRGLDFLPEAKEFGAVKTISKPFQLPDLLAITKELLKEDRTE